MIENKSSPTQGKVIRETLERAGRLIFLFQEHDEQLKSKLRVALIYLNNYGACCAAVHYGVIKNTLKAELLLLKGANLAKFQ